MVRSGAALFAKRMPLSETRPSEQSSCQHDVQALATVKNANHEEAARQDKRIQFRTARDGWLALVLCGGQVGRVLDRAPDGVPCRVWWACLLKTPSAHPGKTLVLRFKNMRLTAEIVSGRVKLPWMRIEPQFQRGAPCNDVASRQVRTCRFQTQPPSAECCCVHA